MKAAVIKNGIVTDIIEINNLNDISGDFTLIEVNNNCQKGYIYNSELNLFTKSIDDLKALKLKEIENEKLITRYQDVAVNGHIYQADKESQLLLNEAITLANAGLPVPEHWIDKDNVQVPITGISDLVAIAAAIKINVNNAIFTARNKKDLLLIADTIEDIEAI